MVTATSLFDRLAALPRPLPNVEAAPPSELVGALIAINRGVLGLKQATLAERAGVSLSTVERIERGEPVSPGVVDKVTVGLGLPVGYFTAPRRPLTDTELAAFVQEEIADLVLVKVDQLRSQSQLRALARCEAIVMMGPDESEKTFDALNELAKRLDFLSFLLHEDLLCQGVRPSRCRRAAYQDVFDQAAALRVLGFAVVAGVTTRPRPNGVDETVALISVTVRADDPGAAARKALFIDRKRLGETNPRRLID
jgi:transcriptional regulator with XRE-family HTH domain